MPEQQPSPFRGRSPGETAHAHFMGALGRKQPMFEDLPAAEQRAWDTAATAAAFPADRDTYPGVLIAAELRVERAGLGHARLYINGYPFPYATVDGYAIHPQRGQMPHVTVSIAADVVTVNDRAESGEMPSPDAYDVGARLGWVIQRLRALSARMRREITMPAHERSGLASLAEEVDQISGDG